MNVVCLRTAAPPFSALHRLCLLDVYGVSVGKEGRGQAVLCGGGACQQWRTVGQGQNSQVARQERLIQQKATSLPSWRSLIGDPALARVGEYRTKTFPDFVHVSHAQRRLEVPVGDITVFCHFINMVPGILIDRGLRYRPSGKTRRAIAKTPVD